MSSRTRRLPVLFPFFFALYPVLSLYAFNVAQTPFSSIVRALLLTLAVTAGLLGLWALPLGGLRRGARRAGLIVSLWLLLFFSFGHVYSYFYEQLHVALPANVLAALWAVIFILGTWGIARKLRRVSTQAVVLLNVVSLGLVVISCVNIPVFLLRNSRSLASASTIDVAPLPLPEVQAPASPPDIYYIILDGYGRSDMLRQVYGVDNTPFLDALRQRGFYIAEQSRPNYAQTALSLSSSLNFHYLPDLFTLDPTSNSREPLEALVRNSAVRRLLKAQGYRMVAFSTWYPVTEISDSDVFFPTIERFNPFETMLLTQSMTIFWIDQTAFANRRMNNLHLFDLLGQTPGLEGPKFVFAHLTVPHPPFVFDRDGGPGLYGGTGDGSAFTGGRENYISGYREQLLYTDQVVQTIVDQILGQSATPPVIIIQGDHGPGAYLDWSSVENTCLPERMAILNAYYLPGGGESQLYPGITPVNTFRVVLNRYFDANLPLEPDRQFFSLWDTPYQLSEVTGQLEGSCPK